MNLPSSLVLIAKSSLAYRNF